MTSLNLPFFQPSRSKLIGLSSSSSTITKGSRVLEILSAALQAESHAYRRQNQAAQGPAGKLGPAESQHGAAEAA